MLASDQGDAAASGEVVGPTPRMVKAAYLCGFVAGLDATSQFFMFPAIRDSLADGDTANASWILTIAGIVGAAVMLQAGRLGDRFGLNRVLIASATVYGVVTTLAALAPNLEVLVAARGLQAAGLAALGVSSLAVIVRETPVERLATVLGTWGFWTSTSGVVGPILTAWLVDVASWRVLFALEIPVAAAVVILAGPGWSAPHEAARNRSIDYLGVALSVGGLALVVLALLEGNDWGWASGQTLGSMVVGLLLVSGVVLRSRVHVDPVIPLDLFRNSAFVLSGLIGLIGAIGFYGMWLTNLSWLIDIWDWSLVEAGLFLTLMPGTMSFLAVRAGRTVDRIGFRTVMVTGAVCWTAGFTWSAVILGPESSGWLMLPTLIGAGIGMATILSPANTAGTRTLPPDRVGTGTAILQTGARIGGALGSALVVVILEMGDRNDIGVHRAAFWFIAGMGAVVALLCAGLSPRRTTLG